MNDSNFIEPSSAAHTDQFQSQKEEFKQHKTQLLSEQVLNNVIPQKNTIISVATIEQLDSEPQPQFNEIFKCKSTSDSDRPLPLVKGPSDIVPASQSTLMVENLEKVKIFIKPEAKAEVKIEIKTEEQPGDKIEKYSFMYMCLVVISIVGYIIGVVFTFDSNWAIEPQIGTILLSIVVVSNFLFALEALQSKNADRQMYVYIVFCIVLFVNTIAVMCAFGLQVEYFENLDNIPCRLLVGLWYVVNLALVRLAGIMRNLMVEKDLLLQKSKPKTEYKTV